MGDTEQTNDRQLHHGTQNECFGCGEANDAGLQLRFFVDAQDRVLCRLRLHKRFQGPPGHAHGGIIATCLDEAMSKANRRRGIVAMTRHMAIDYERPVPLDHELELEGWSERDPASTSGRKHLCSAQLRDVTGMVLASATGVFIEVPAEILARYSKRFAE